MARRSAAILGLILAGCSSPKPSAPLETAYWYWHTPFHLDKATEAGLKDKGVKKLFVRAGTFTTDGKRLLMVLPQKWQSKSPFELHLVFNFDSGAVSHFEKLDLDTMVADIATRIAARQKEADQPVTGIQLDLDCPTRLLPRYAELIRKLRPKLPNGQKISTTALMSWLDSPNAQTLARELDFICPQAYEGFTGRTVDKMRPVSDPRELKRLLPKMEQLACPVYVGLPAYGHAFEFDQKGKLTDIFREIPPKDLFRIPGLIDSEAYPSDRLGQPAKNKDDWTGEQILKLRFPDRTIGYTIPTQDLLDKTRQIVEANRPRNCPGIIVYRVRDEHDSLALPLKPAGPPKLEIEAEFENDSFEAIEGGSNETPTEIYLTIKNIGGPTFTSKDSVEIIIEAAGILIDDVHARDALAAEPGRITANGFEKTSPRDATAVKLRIPFLAAQETIEIGAIRLASRLKSEAKIHWTARAVDGFETASGEAVASPKPKGNK